MPKAKMSNRAALYAVRKSIKSLNKMKAKEELDQKIENSALLGTLQNISKTLKEIVTLKSINNG